MASRACSSRVASVCGMPACRSCRLLKPAGKACWPVHSLDPGNAHHRPLQGVERWRTVRAPSAQCLFRAVQIAGPVIPPRSPVPRGATGPLAHQTRGRRPVRCFFRPFVVPCHHRQARSQGEWRHLPLPLRRGHQIEGWQVAIRQPQRPARAVLPESARPSAASTPQVAGCRGRMTRWRPVPALPCQTEWVLLDRCARDMPGRPCEQGRRALKCIS